MSSDMARERERREWEEAEWEQLSRQEEREKERDRRIQVLDTGTAHDAYAAHGRKQQRAFTNALQSQGGGGAAWLAPSRRPTPMCSHAILVA